MFQFAFRGTSGVAIIKKIAVAAAQTLVKGNPVVETNGITLMAPAAADGTVIGVMNQASAAQLVGTEVEVIVCDGETVFKAGFFTGGAKTTFDANDIGTAFDVNAANPSIVDPNDTLDGAWVLVDYDNANAVCWVKCLATKRHPVAR